MADHHWDEATGGYEQMMDRRDDQFLDEEKAAEELAKTLEVRGRTVRAADAVSPYAIRLGASNAPADCAIFSNDYRDRLPKGDPVRSLGGSPSRDQSSDLRAMRAAHRVGLMAARTPLPR
jgi:hypothetical protein